MLLFAEQAGRQPPDELRVLGPLPDPSAHVDWRSDDPGQTPCSQSGHEVAAHITRAVSLAKSDMIVVKLMHFASYETHITF